MRFPHCLCVALVVGLPWFTAGAAHAQADLIGVSLSRTAGHLFSLAPVETHNQASTAEALGPGLQETGSSGADYVLAAMAGATLGLGVAWLLGTDDRENVQGDNRIYYAYWGVPIGAVVGMLTVRHFRSR